MKEQQETNCNNPVETVVNGELKDEIVKIRYKISTDNVGSECADIVEIDKVYWDSLSDTGKHNEMKDVAFEHLEWSYKEVE